MRANGLMSAGPLLCVVDDDESVRESLPDLLGHAGYDVHAYSCAEDFLMSGDADVSRCVILDMTMPGMNGPELQQQLARQGKHVPIVFITANADPALRQLVLSRGALACLSKPFYDEALLDAVRCALDRR